MAWEFNNDLPIYIQLIEQIKLGIFSGTYPIGEKLPSVREMAQVAAVNPNTMQKALSELEDERLIYIRRNIGSFVTEDTDLIKKMQRKMAVEYTKSFINKINQIGLRKEESISLIERILKGDNTNG